MHQTHSTRRRRVAATATAGAAHLDMHLHDEGVAALSRISADVRLDQAAPVHFNNLPELIRWLAQLELQHRRGGGGIR